jgi:Na+/proline symporter
VTTLYTVVGGLYSVVLTDLIQFVIMIVCSVALGIVAMQWISPETLAAAIPEGWSNIWFGWHLDLDWSALMPAAQAQTQKDGYALFSAFFGMMVFKGILISLAGPAPNYDMQRILAAKNPREAALMSGFVTIALFVPRYLMIASIAVLALALIDRNVTAVSDSYFEQLLPAVIHDYVPIGLKGLVIAGLLAAFMSTFSGTINAAAAYLVNDVYRRYARPVAPEREYIRASYVASLLVVIAGCSAGLFIPSVAKATNWIVSGLWVGYAAPNVLKWYWWRLNGWGYFWGMMLGIGAALATAFFPAVNESMAAPSIWLVSQLADTSGVSFDVNLMAFPTVLAISLLGTLAGSLLTRPGEESELLSFYTRTRPWGWWKPIERAAVRQNPSFEPNRDFARDAFNVLIGIIWQTAFVALPIYVVIHYWKEAAICVGVIVATSAILKMTWYDRLESYEVD